MNRNSSISASDIATRKSQSFIRLEKLNKNIKNKFIQSEKRLSHRRNKLIATIDKDENIRHELAVKVEKLKELNGALDRKVAERTAELKDSLAMLEQKVFDRTKSLENANIAIQNILEDLNSEKIKSEVARAKEEAILLSIGEGLLACDENGLIILMNKSAEDLLGCSAIDSIGRTFYEIISIEDEKGEIIPLVKRPLGLALSDNITTTVTVTDPAHYYMRKDKTKFPVALVVTPIISNGKVIGAIDAFRDITHEKEIDKAKSEFVSLSSHQLRTPLTAISWYTEMLVNGDLGQVSTSQKEYLEKIYDSVRRMVEMINNFLNVSRIELGTFKYEPEPVNIVELIQDVVDEQKPKILTQKLTIIEKFDNNIPIIETDPQLLHMVFQNLLSNAVKYTPSGGKVKLTISIDTKKDVLVKVTDTGFGIPDNQKDQIFNKLFRADNVRSKEIDGTGLGLYIVKSIIENSGGRVWFESKENKGSTFYVSVPSGLVKEIKSTK
jgi:PAS domain S-box-containing protein